MGKSNRICDRCDKSFTTPRKLRDHQHRKFQCKLKEQLPEEPQEQLAPQEPTIVQLQKPSSLSVDELANWLAGPSNKSAIPQKQVPKTNLEWYDSMLGAPIPQPVRPKSPELQPPPRP
jgi:hypothetical protein